jgi:fatty-acyl-CoA synthase
MSVAHDAVWPPRVPRAIELPVTSLWFNLEASARRHPDLAASLFFGRAQRYRELHAQAEALAGWLQHHGVTRGDRVAIFLQNCPQFLVAVYGTWRADAVVVPVNPMLRADELAHCLADAGVRCVVAAGDALPVVAEAIASLDAGQRPAQVLVVRYADALPAPGDPALDEMPVVWRPWLLHDAPLPANDAPTRWQRWSDALAAGHVPGEQRDGIDALALVAYTSGTTGRPKGCMHRHASLTHNTMGAALWMGGMAPGHAALGAVPMFHITGFVYSVCVSVAHAATLVLMPRWERELAARLIPRHRIKRWTCIPTMVIDLIASPSVTRETLASIEVLSGGGSAMPQAVAERLAREFGQVFIEGYGLTETAAPSHSNPLNAPRQQCLGIPIIGCDSRVIDPDTLVELPAGETGEIVTAGPMVFDGYWQQPEATAAAFVELDGKRFFRSGDLGHRDGEGYFFITDRLKRMINASGFKVWPSEVELLLFKCPQVQEACVIAVPDAYRGETVKAVIVPRAGITPDADAVIAWAREHMAAYKVPRIVEFVESLPKSGTGKVMWRLLRERERDVAPKLAALAAPKGAQVPWGGPAEPS